MNLLLADEMQDIFALLWFFSDLRVLVRKLASLFGHSTQVSTKVQLAATCNYLRLSLAKALQQGRFPLTGLGVRFSKSSRTLENNSQTKDSCKGGEIHYIVT